MFYCHLHQKIVKIFVIFLGHKAFLSCYENLWYLVY